MRTLKKDFMDILEKQRIKPVFQPIVNLKTGETIGYEALSRIVKPEEIANTEELFHLAGVYGKVWELEQICRGKILEKYHSNKKSNDNKLFINVNPMVIHDREFRSGFTSSYLKQYELNQNEIVFEVTERNSIDDLAGFKDTIRHYKQQGYTIAVDDAGSCYSGLNLICDIVPHYLKLDMNLIHDIHNDTIKYAMVKAMVEFSNLVHIELIAEGIECEEELKALLKLGVHNGQGYFLRKPAEELKEIEESALEIIRNFNEKRISRWKRYNDDAKELRAILFKFDNYKAYSAYCDLYGDEKGDRMIEEFKAIIQQNLSEEESAICLGEDSVLVVLEKQNAKIKSEIIVRMFHNKLNELYQEADIKKGYIERKNKHGENKKYPLVAIRTERVV